MIYVAYYVLSSAALYLFYRFISNIADKKSLNMKVSIMINVMFIYLVLLSLVYVMDYHSFFKIVHIQSLIKTFKSTLELMVVLFAIFTIIYLMIGVFGKKYTLRVENFNIGGINIFFDKSSEVFIKSVGTFIGAKRTLFSFNKQRDNISEVLDAYYEVYKFIRSNIDLLDQDRDSDIAHVSIEIIMRLNRFLTKHQNDYRRWYNKIVEKDKILCDGKDIKVHSTTIEEVQSHYYRYDEIIVDIAKINEYMRSNEVKKIFRINLFEWEEDINA